MPSTNFYIMANATQAKFESDSFGNDYDENAPSGFIPVSTARQLEKVFTEAEAGKDLYVFLFYVF